MLIRIAKAAEVAGVTRATIYAAIKRGELRYASGADFSALKRADVEAWRDRPDRAGPQGGRPRDAGSRRSRAAKKKEAAC